MRLTLNVLLSLLALPAMAHAQSDDFNPYQGIIDGMSAAEAEPLIIAAYGEIDGDFGDVAEPYAGGPMRILSTGSGRDFATFLFCDDALVAFSAPLTSVIAAAILEPLTIPGMGSSIYPNADGITVLAVNDELQVGYVGIGTKSSRIMATYPATALYRLDYKSLCPAADN